MGDKQTAHGSSVEHSPDAVDADAAPSSSSKACKRKGRGGVHGLDGSSGSAQASELACGEAAPGERARAGSEQGWQVSCIAARDRHVGLRGSCPKKLK